MRFRWRPLLPTDISEAWAVSARVHPDFPESDAVFADRQAIAPDCCFVLEDDAGAAYGYVLAHPYRLGGAPALDTVLSALPAMCDTLYIHDLALLPAARGSGAARAIVAKLAGLAAPYGPMSLIAIDGSVPFWSRMGFEIVPVPHLLDTLSSYGPGAGYMTRTDIARNAG